MKIVSETQSLLTLKQGTISSYIIGIVFLVIGVGICLVSFSAINKIILFLGLIFAIAGGAVILFAKSYTLTMDKSTKVMRILSLGVLGRKVQDIQMSQIKEVSLEEYITNNYSNNNLPREQMNFTLVFYLNDGTGIPFRIGSSGNFTLNGLPLGMFTARNKNVQLGNKIAAFLEVPFVDRRPPSFQQAINEVVQTIQSKKPFNEVPPTSNPPSRQ